MAHLSARRLDLWHTMPASSGGIWWDLLVTAMPAHQGLVQWVRTGFGKWRDLPWRETLCVSWGMELAHRCSACSHYCHYIYI